jgi:hypothetical protein
METTRLSPAQGRLLAHLDAYPQWHTLLELEAIRLLEEDDVLTVASLVERGLVYYFSALRAVAITPAGEDSAQEFR